MILLQWATAEFYSRCSSSIIRKNNLSQGCLLKLRDYITTIGIDETVMWTCRMAFSQKKKRPLNFWEARENLSERDAFHRENEWPM